MPRMSKKRKHELSFYLNDRGRVTYNELCRKCQHGCKQSFRAVVVDYRHTIAALYAISQSIDRISSQQHRKGYVLPDAGRYAL